jgi:hypothetical protein
MKSALVLVFSFFWIFAIAENNPNTNGSNFLKNKESSINHLSATSDNLAPDVLEQFEISGTCYRAGNPQVPFAGVAVTFSGIGTVTTNSQGYYAKLVNKGWTGTVTPYYCGLYVFAPSIKYYTNVKENFTNQNFVGTASQMFTISGTITKSTDTLPLANYFIDFGNGYSVTTNALGQYSIQVMPCESYTFTPTSADYNFNPLNRSYPNIMANFSNQNYTATPKFFPIPPGWQYSNTGTVHIIAAMPYCNPNFCGTPLQQGDWIGVFYVGDDGLLHCGGAGMWNGTQSTAIIAQGDDTYTPQKDGFAASEVMNWKVYSWTLTQQEYPADPVYETGGFLLYDNKWGSGGLSKIISLPAYSKTHNLVIPQGWSGISSYLLPRPSTLAVNKLFAPVVNNLIILKDLTKTYWPSQNINTIGNWSSTTGYTIKLSAPVTLPITGCDVATKTMNFADTWRLIPIISSCNVPIETLFAGKLNKITIIKEIAGTNVYWPEMNIKTLLTLQPGLAYMIKTNSSAIFTVTFPTCTNLKDEEIVTPAFVNNSPWNDPIMSPSSHSVAISSGVFDKLMAGDIIGAFTDDGICAGLVQIDNLSTSVLLQVFGDDPTTFEKDGYEDNEILNFKLYRPQLEQEFMIGFDFDASLPSSDGHFAADGLSAASKIVFNPTFIGENGNNSISFYPNPSNGLIEFVAGDNQKSFDVTILDLTGQKVYETTFSAKARINLSEAPKGIYIVKIESGNFIKIEKLVVQ